MSMTREEAIESYEKLYGYMVGDDDAVELDYGEFMELNHYIRAALRGPTRKLVERMRGEWIQDEHGQVTCSRCRSITAIGTKNALYNAKKYDRFCFYCGAPMTDEAVEMVMERLHENT